MVSALLLTTVQAGLVLSFPTGGELVYRESWRISESDESAKLTATAERTMRMRVKETSKGKTRFEVTFQDLNVRSEDKGLADDLRSWVDQPDRDQWVTERGYTERKGDEVKAGRPFFGIVLPPTTRTFPANWSAKLLTPIGSDRQVDFKFQLDSGASDLPILISAKDKFGSTQLEITGRATLSLQGTVLNGDLTTSFTDSDTKTTTVIEYRFQKQ